MEAGKLDLNHSELRSDKGFMVNVTQAYPGMKPYLKVVAMRKVGNCHQEL